VRILAMRTQDKADAGVIVHFFHWCSMSLLVKLGLVRVVMRSKGLGELKLMSNSNSGTLGSKAFRSFGTKHPKVSQAKFAKTPV